MKSPSDLIAPIQKGDYPMDEAQVKQKITWSRNTAITEIQQVAMLALDPEGASQVAYLLQILMDDAISNNEFNHQLRAYRNAVKRLNRYRLAEGRTETTEEQETGEFDEETGDPIIETVTIQTSVEPLPAEVEATTYDQDTGEVTGTEMVPNPEITQDEEERAAAQEIIDATPQQVKDYNNGA